VVTIFVETIIHSKQSLDYPSTLLTVHFFLFFKMSYFNAQPFVFQFQGQQPPSISENEPPKQWNFPQTQIPSYQGANGQPQMYHINTSCQTKANRKKRSSSDDEDCQPEEQVFASTCVEGGPTKRRKGLSDATAPVVNSIRTTNYWGKLAH
jgi:hypothetical protein